jgi:transposase-like protein
MTKSSDQYELIPPYCPNPQCLFHLGSEEKFYAKNGFSITNKPPFRNQRFKCTRCKIQFSCNTFGLDFRKRSPGFPEKILHYSLNGMSNNSIARLLKVAEGTVRDRLKNMARQSLLFEKANDPKKIDENVAYDGFETFSGSQFSPCYVNTAVGSHSMFIYHNTFSPLNRKGRMTNDQKIKNQELINRHGLYPQSSVYEETIYVMKNLSHRAAGRTLFTDEHRSYMRAYRSFACQMELKTISSKARRDSSNPLFPINRLHNLYRHFFSSQQRETISFQKHEAALMEKLQLMKIYRNFMNPKFVKKNKYDPHAHEWSPAMYIGVAGKILTFSEVFGVRKLKSQSRLDNKELEFMNRCYPFSRQKMVA